MQSKVAKSASPIVAWVQKHPITASGAAALPTIWLGYEVAAVMTDLGSAVGWLVNNWSAIADFSQTSLFRWMVPFLLLTFILLLIRSAAKQDERRHKIEMEKTLVVEAAQNRLIEISEQTMRDLYGYIDSSTTLATISRRFADFTLLKSKLNNAIDRASAAFPTKENGGQGQHSRFISDRNRMVDMARVEIGKIGSGVKGVDVNLLRPENIDEQALRGLDREHTDYSIFDEGDQRDYDKFCVLKGRIREQLSCIEGALYDEKRKAEKVIDNKRLNLKGP